MKKVNLTNEEYLRLDVEINGLADTRTGEIAQKGLLQETIPVKVRFWASRVNSKIEGIKKAVESTREDLIKKYGEADKDGNTRIHPIIKEKGKDVPNPNIEQFMKEMGDVLKSEEEIEIPELSIEDLGDFSTDVNLTIIFKLID